VDWMRFVHQHHAREIGAHNMRLFYYFDQTDEHTTEARGDFVRKCNVRIAYFEYNDDARQSCPARFALEGGLTHGELRLYQ
jgi:hypothetical protein